MKRRVLQVFPYHLAAETGGESGVKSVIEAIVQLTSDELDHVVLAPAPSPHHARLRELGADVVTLGREEHLILRRQASKPQLVFDGARTVAEATRIARLVRGKRIDIVHSHSAAYLGGLVGARLARRPGILHVHERMDRLSPGTARALRRGIALAASDVVLIARFLEQEWRGSGARTTYLPNTALVVPRPRAPLARPVVGFVGRIAPRKGVEYLLRAFASVRAELPDARLVIYGGPAEPEDYTYLDALRRERAELGLTDAVEIAGSAADVADVYAAIDVLAFCSPIDIAPVTVLEAMAAGLPVVSASDGGAAEMVADGVSGFTVPPRDVGALAARLTQLLRDEGLRRQLGDAARARFEEVYGPGRFRAGLLALYEAAYHRRS